MSSFLKPNPRISGTSKAALALGASLLILAAAASSASAATIGQVSPSTDLGCQAGFDWVQAASAGNPSYEVPSGGKTITSWSTNAWTAAGEKMEFKVFRPTGAHGGYSVVGHDGPRDLVPGTTNTFPVNIPVKPGDLLGLHTTTTGPCDSNGGSMDTVDSLFGDLGDAGSGMFTPNERSLLNVSAVVTTSGGGRAAALKKCKKKHGAARAKCKKKAKKLPV
jgi:hypothetical protein